MANPSVKPDSQELTAENHAFTEEVEVTIPPTGSIGNVDVYFVADNTGSMSDVISSVSKHSAEILDKFVEKAKSIGVPEQNLCFGVGNYTDFDVTRGNRGFTHQLKMTTDRDQIRAALGAWHTSNNQTTAEQNLYALDQIATEPGTSGGVGWRPGAKKIIIWIGDAPSHDPISSSHTGLSYEITTQSVIDKLTKHDIAVIALSTIGSGGSSSPGLDTNPNDHGNMGDQNRAVTHQASKIVGATHGQYADDIKTEAVVDKLMELGGLQITSIKKVRLVPEKQIGPFLIEDEWAEIHPREGDRTLPGGQEHHVMFDVHWRGVTQENRGTPPATKPVDYWGALDVVIDGVGSKTHKAKVPVHIQVPDLSGKYKLQNTQNGDVLRMDPHDTSPGGVVYHGQEAGGGHEIWQLIPVSGGGYQIKNQNENPNAATYMEVVGQSTDEKAQVLVRNEANDSEQHKQWLLIPTGSDRDGTPIYKIQNVHSGHVVDLSGGGDPPVIQYHYWGNYRAWRIKHQQHFRLIPA